MAIRIEVPDIPEVLPPRIDEEDQRAINRATILEVRFEEGDEIGKGETFALIYNDHGTHEVVAPASGVLACIFWEEGNTVSSDDVLATIDTDRWHGWTKRKCGKRIAREGSFAGQARAVRPRELKISPDPQSDRDRLVAQDFR